MSKLGKAMCVGALAFGLLVACKEEPAPPAPSIASASSLPSVSELTVASSPPPAALEPAPPPEVTVTLITPGEEPRAPLRYALRAGDVSAVTTTITTKNDVAFGDRKAPAQDAPPTILEFELEVGSDTGGTFTILRRVKDVSFGEGTMPPASKRPLEAFRQALRGFEVRYSFSTRGETSETVADPSTSARTAFGPMLANLTQALGHLGTLLPEESVGPGAKWKVTGELDVAGMRVTQETTTELLSREGERLKLRSVVVQRGRPGPVAIPGMPEGAPRPVLDRMTARGTGDLELSLDGPVTTGNIETTSDVIMSVTTPAGPQKITTKSVVTVVTAAAAPGRARPKAGPPVAVKALAAPSAAP